MLKRILISTLAVFALSAQAAEVYLLPPSDTDVIGTLRLVKSHADETMLDIGRRYGVGYEEMRLANPGVDMFVPGEGTEIRVPTRFILPDARREGLVLNVPEMRLYYFPKPREGQAPIVITYPVSIGRMDWSTPLGDTKVITKVADPAWYPPKSIREEAAADGKELPKMIPPGPDNPLGRFAMRLTIPGYLIHGTNRPYGVGMRVTHGCVRMYPEDIEQLFALLPKNTPVQIINQPYKAGWFGDLLYVEAHPLLEEDRDKLNYDYTPVLEVMAKAMEGRSHRIDRDRLAEVVKETTGIPELVSRGESG